MPYYGSVNRRLNSKLPTPEIKLEGDWNKTSIVLDSIPALVKLGSIKGQQSAAKKLLRIVKRHIRNNGAQLGWQPLAVSTQLKKAKSGYDSQRILYWTGIYYNNIKKWNKNSRVYVGVKKGLYHPGSRITVGQIANVLEHGSSARNIPARPLWQPSFRQFGGNKRLRGLITWHIANEFYLKHGFRPQISI